MSLNSNLNQRAISVLRSPALVGDSWRCKLVVMLVVLMTCGVVAGRPATAQDVPSGTIQLSGGAVAVGVGYTWGSGTLIYHGNNYPLKVSGLSMLQVGAGSYTATGSVYHLTQPSDIDGTYTAISAGVAVAGGASGTAMKNSRGVVIQLAATQKGLNFTLGPKGVTITLEGTPQ